MESTINERFTELIEALRINANAFAKSLNKSYTAIDNTIKGKSEPGYKLLESVFTAYPQVNPDWLLLGEGSMFRSIPAKQAVTGAGADEYLREHLRQLEESFRQLSVQLEKKDEQFGKIIDQKDSLIENLNNLLKYQRELLGKPKRDSRNRFADRIHDSLQATA